MASRNVNGVKSGKQDTTTLTGDELRQLGFAAGEVDGVPTPDEGSNLSDDVSEEENHSQSEDLGSSVDPFAIARRAAKVDRPNLGLPDDPAWEQYPALMGWLCKQQYRLNRSRKPSRVSLVATEKGFTLTIPDEGMDKKAVVQFQHLGQALEAAEAFLRNPSSKFAVLGYGEGYNRKKSEERKDIEKRGSQW
jgi:hypothetical protein